MKGLSARWNQQELQTQTPISLKHCEVGMMFQLLYCSHFRFPASQVADLLGYQNLVITSHLDFPDFKWEEYDQEFRLLASVSPMVSDGQY